MPTEAELRRRNQAGTLVDWALVDDTSSATGHADPTVDQGTRDALTSLLAELQGKLEAGQQVDLAPATVTLLRDVTAAVTGTVGVSNFPATYPDGHTQPLTDAQLRAAVVPVNVANPTADPETGLAKDATLNTLLLELGDKLEAGQEVALSAATLAALEQVTATISNLPAEYPLPAAQVQTDALTDAELRATHLRVADDYTQGEILADQTATAGGAVLTFTFSTTVHGIWIAAVDPADLSAIGEVRVAPFGGTPSPSFGIPVPYGSPFPVPVTTPTVKVYADGARVTLVGNIR